MTSYAGFIALDSVASLKEEFPFGRYLAGISVVSAFDQVIN